MKGILVNDTDEIKVKFAIARNKFGAIVGDTTKDSLKQTYGDNIDEATIEEHEAVFRRPTFGDSIDIAGSLGTDGLTLSFNPFAIRFQRMGILLKSWTLKEGDKPIAATKEMILKIDPVVANLIGIQLDAAVGI